MHYYAVVSLNNIWSFNVSSGNWRFISGEIMTNLSQPNTLYGSVSNASMSAALPSARSNFAWVATSTARLFVYGGTAAYFTLSSTFSKCDLIERNLIIYLARLSELWLYWSFEKSIKSTATTSHASTDSSSSVIESNTASATAGGDNSREDSSTAAQTDGNGLTSGPVSTESSTVYSKTDVLTGPTYTADVSNISPSNTAQNSVAVTSSSYQPSSIESSSQVVSLEEEVIYVDTENENVGYQSIETTAYTTSAASTITKDAAAQSESILLSYSPSLSKINSGTTVSPSSNPSSLNNNMQSILQYAIIGGGTLGVVVLTSLAVYVYRRRQLSKRLTYRAQSEFHSNANMMGSGGIEMTKIATQHGTMYGVNATQMTYMNTEIARNIATLVTPQRELTVPAFLQRETRDFTTIKQIAKGGGGTVYIGKTSHPDILSKVSSGQIIVKVFDRPEDPSPIVQKDFIQSFNQEVAMMWFFNGQRNFAEIFGYCVNPWIIIMRFYEFGSLQGLIHEQNKQENLQNVHFTHQLARQLATDIAIGLNEMHINGFAHSDVKTANILLDLDRHQNRLIAVLTDFGIARVVNENALLVRAFRVNDNNGGSYAYAGPEVLDRLFANPPQNVSQFPKAQQLSTAADTYAFAIVVYELLTRMFPWKELNSLDDLHRCVKAGDRPTIPSDLRMLSNTDMHVKTMLDVMIQCWHGDPFSRPRMSVVLNQLH
jgi:hypothetical protein